MVYRCGHSHNTHEQAVECVRNESSWRSVYDRLRWNIAEGWSDRAAASARVLYRRARRMGLLPDGLLAGRA